MSDVQGVETLILVHQYTKSLMLVAEEVDCEFNTFRHLSIVRPFNKISD